MQKKLPLPKKPLVREKSAARATRERTVQCRRWVWAALWGGGGRRAGRRSCGITPISVIRSSAVAGRGGEMAIQGALEGLSSTPDGRYQAREN